MKHTTTTRLILLARDPAQPSTCLHIDPAGRILSRHLLDATQPTAAGGTRDIVAVPGEAVRLLWVDLPARHPAQALAAARLLLEDHLAVPVDGQHIAIAPMSADPATGGRRLLAVVDQATMHDWLRRCAQLGIVPSSMLPDCLLLEAPGDDDTLLAVMREGLWLVRGRQLAFTAEADLARLLAGNRPLHALDGPDAEARLAAGAATAGGAAPDLLQYGHARRDPGTRRRNRRLVALAVAVLLSPVLVNGLVALRYSLGAYWLQTRADVLAVAHAPVLAAASDPSAALHAQYARLTAADTLAVRSAALFNALRDVPGTHLDSYEFSTEAGVRVGLVHADERDLEALRERLATAGLVPVPLDSQPFEGGTRTLLSVETLP